MHEHERERVRVRVRARARAYVYVFVLLTPAPACVSPSVRALVHARLPYTRAGELFLRVARRLSRGRTLTYWP